MDNMKTIAEVGVFNDEAPVGMLSRVVFDSPIKDEGSWTINLQGSFKEARDDKR